MSTGKAPEWDDDDDGNEGGGFKSLERWEIVLYVGWALLAFIAIGAFILFHRVRDTGLW